MLLLLCRTNPLMNISRIRSIDNKNFSQIVAQWSPKIFVDIEIDMGYKRHMDIGKVLRELLAKEKRSLRKTSIDLGVDRSTLHRSLKKGNPEWKTIERVLNYLGYGVKFVKKKKTIGLE